MEIQIAIVDAKQALNEREARFALALLHVYKHTLWQSITLEKMHEAAKAGKADVAVEMDALYEKVAEDLRAFARVYFPDAEFTFVVNP
jgi:hypothetical protein